MIKPNQLREYIIWVLSAAAYDLDLPTLYHEDAVELLMLTAAQETHLGSYLKQVGDGPALGIFQIEPATYSDLQTNWLAYKPDLKHQVLGWQSPSVPDKLDLQGNLPYQIVIARLIYFRNPEPIPSRKDIPAMAKYYKKWWNTSLGKATVEEAIENYKRYVLEG